MIIDYETAYYIVVVAIWISALIQCVPIIWDKHEENKKKRQEKREKKYAVIELEAEIERLKKENEDLKLIADIENGKPLTKIYPSADEIV